MMLEVLLGVKYHVAFLSQACASKCFVFWGRDLVASIFVTCQGGRRKTYCVELFHMLGREQRSAQLPETGIHVRSIADLHNKELHENLQLR